MYVLIYILYSNQLTIVCKKHSYGLDYVLNGSQFFISHYSATVILLCGYQNTKLE